jgi:CheY-like chemotaxis protein
LDEESLSLEHPVEVDPPRFLKNSPQYANFVVCRPEGRVIASAVPLIAALNFSDRPYFRDLIKNKSFTIGQYVMGRITGKPIIVFGYPVLDRQGKEIAIAVLDVVMPKMGGKQAYDEMIKRIPGLKVLFLSGYSFNAIHDDFVLRPGLPFLQKPFGPEALARKVREVLDR